MSAEHHKAMTEQQKKFQLDIAQLRKALEQNNMVISQQNHVAMETPDPQLTVPMDADTLETNTARDAETGMDVVEDSSDDMASVPSVRRTSAVSSLSAAKAALASPARKRPKRSKSKSQTGRGGLNSSSRKSNV